jgi:hypothetical protein
MRRLTLSVLAVSLSAVPLATADSGGSVTVTLSPANWPLTLTARWRLRSATASRVGACSRCARARARALAPATTSARPAPGSLDTRTGRLIPALRRRSPAPRDEVRSILDGVGASRRRRPAHTTRHRDARRLRLGCPSPDSRGGVALALTRQALRFNWAMVAACWQAALRLASAEASVLSELAGARSPVRNEGSPVRARVPAWSLPAPRQMRARPPARLDRACGLLPWTRAEANAEAEANCSQANRQSIATLAPIQLADTLPFSWAFS